MSGPEKKAFVDLWTNYTLWLPITMALGVQTFKFFWEWHRAGEFDFQVLHQAGGMPSSHTAMVTSLATAVAWREGLGSAAFAIAVVVALIVMYDARGVRQESGKQARLLNHIVREFFSHQTLNEGELKELVGHTPMEVVVGALVGLIVTLLALVFMRPAL